MFHFFNMYENMRDLKTHDQLYGSVQQVNLLGGCVEKSTVAAILTH